MKSICSRSTLLSSRSGRKSSASLSLFYKARTIGSYYGLLLLFALLFVVLIMLELFAKAAC